MTPVQATARMTFLLLAVVAVWRGTGFVFGNAYVEELHLLHGAAISAAVLVAVGLLLRLDRLPWRVLGHHGLRANLRAFASGALLWLVPALVGGAACMAMGWVAFEPRAPGPTLAGAVPALLLGVFLLEAFPEELAIRGYAQGVAARAAPPWVAVLVQAALFTLFAWAVGAMGSAGQWMFIPCFGLILGYVRAVTGSVWASMGVHAAWMTTTQWLHASVAVEGLQALQLVAFALLPSATIGTVLGLARPDFEWRRAGIA